MKILIVADAAVGAFGLEQLLSEQGHTAIVAHSAADAISMLGEHDDIEAVLTDATRLDRQLAARLAAATEIARFGGADGATGRFVLLSLSAANGGDDGILHPPKAGSIGEMIDARALLHGLNLLARRQQRFDAAHHQLRDYVDQRARWLVRIDEEQFDGLASTH